MVIWITGRSSAGKTVYSKRLKEQFEKLGGKVLLLDGDTVRQMMKNNDYSDVSIEKHIMTTASFGAIAESQGYIVIIALISPMKRWRMRARKKFDKSMLIYMPGGQLWDNTKYEEPDHEEMMIEG